MMRSMITLLTLIFITFSVQVNLMASDRDNPFQEVARGDTFSIDLKEAILTALEKNPNVSIQRLVPRLSGSYVREQRGIFDPEISLSANQSQTKLLRFLGSRPDPFELTTDRSQFDAAISQTLPMGTTLTAGATMSGTLSSIYTDQYTGSIGLTINQALLQGFGLGTNLANLRKSKLDLEISNLELKAIAEETTASVEKAYWDLYLTGEEVHIQKKSLELANRLLEESKERVAVGKLPVLELAAVHAEVATRREALIDAQSHYEQARIQFLYLVNLDSISWSDIPMPVEEPLIPDGNLDPIEIHEQLAFKYRPDLLQAKLEVKKGAIDVTQTRNGLLPRLDLFISLNRTTYAQTFREAIPDIKSPFYDISGGATFAFPIPNRMARAQAQRAQISKEQMDIALNNMERLVQQDIRSAYIEVLRSAQQIEATRVAHDLQEKKLEAELEKFRVGKSTNYLVLQAQRDFVASELNEARSTVAYLNAIVNLQVMEGTLLDRRGIMSAIE